MADDIHSHGITLVNTYTQFFLSELNNIFAGKSLGVAALTRSQPRGLQPTDISCMSSDLSGLASQFIRELAAEATRQCMANEGGGAGMRVSTSADILPPNQARGGDR